MVNTFFKGKINLPKQSISEMAKIRKHTINLDSSIAIQEPVLSLISQCSVQLSIIDGMMEQTIRPIERSYALLKDLHEKGSLDDSIKKLAGFYPRIPELYKVYYSNAFKRLYKQRDELETIYQGVEDRSIFDTPIEKQYELLQLRFDELLQDISYNSEEHFSQLKKILKTLERN